MQRCIAYIRVSTVKQGEKGVSLQEQRQAITDYATRHNLTISEWFEEKETAARRGRPAFAKVIALLRKGKASGVIIHKIDRGARNLKDWADLAELIDSGTAVYIAGDNLDMHSRGGRLSADIQAVVAADFIRNLREETKKGMRGRLRQGLLPNPAPPGYLDCGPGKPKAIDPIKGPLIRQAFELYASEKYNLRTLQEEMIERGLVGRSGKPIALNTLSRILKNPFYIGLIEVNRTGETFAGIHEPLVPPGLFKLVQAVLQDREHKKVRRHAFIFRRAVRCGVCARFIVGELQRGYVYYRCHNRACTLRPVREEKLDEDVKAELARCQLSDPERTELHRIITSQTRDSGETRRENLKTLELQKRQTSDRLMRLTDAFLDSVIEKEVFEERKRLLLIEQKELDEKHERIASKGEKEVDPSKPLERADMALLSYILANPEEKREFLKSTCSNITRFPNGGSVELSIPFSWIANRHSLPGGVPSRDSSRRVGNVPEAAESSRFPYLEELVRKIRGWLEEK